MDLSKLTTRAQQALVAARDQATARNHGAIHPAHLLRALVAQTEGLVLPLLQAIDVAPNDARQLAEVELNKLPLVYGGSEPQMTQDLARVLEIADQRRSDFKDDYISVEHLLLSLAESSGPVGNALRELGVRPEAILEGLKNLRGNQRITSADPEATFQALEQYGRDLTAVARDGKLDPVIGRDEEIRHRDPGAVPKDQEQPGPHR